jgi:hypothetical protein
MSNYPAGVLIGFSQGGDYVKKWPDPVFKGKTRYTADPGEVSAVDSPCLPMALVESMKGKTFELQKSSGTVEVKQFDIPAEMELRLQKAERQYLALHTKHAEDLRVLSEMTKSLKVAAEAEGGTTMAEKITDAAGFTKAAKSLHEHLSSLKKAHEARHEEISSHIEKCMKAVGAMEEGDQPEKVAASDMVKGAALLPDGLRLPDPAILALQKSNETLVAAVAELTKKLEKTPETAAAHTGVQADFEKSTGYIPEQSGEGFQTYAPPGFNDGEAAEALKKARGNLVTI